jgi:hypothetical protein
MRFEFGHLLNSICGTRPRNYLLSSLFYNSTFI